MKPELTSFSETQFASLYPVGMEAHYWVKARNMILSKELTKLGLSDGGILDIGCGPGMVLHHLRQEGFNAWGVELGHPEVNLPCSQWMHTGCSVRELAPELRGSIKAVTILDVIEHLPEPELMIREALDSLPNLEWIILTVPAREELWSNFDEYNGHFRRYTRESMLSLLHGLGLEPTYVEHFFHFLYFPVYAAATLDISRSTKNERPSPVWLHRLLARAFVLEKSLIPGYCPGTSLIALVPIRRVD